MSPDQFLIWGATRVTRNNEERAGILPSKVGPVLDLWSVPFLPSCGSAVVCNWGPSLLSQCRQGISFSNLLMLGLGLQASWSSCPWFQGPWFQVHHLLWVRPWPQKMSCARGGLGHLEVIWSQVYEWPCHQQSLSHFPNPRICVILTSLCSLWCGLVSSSLACDWPGTGWFSGMIFQTASVAAAWCDPSAGAKSFPLEALVSYQFISPDLIPNSWTRPSFGLGAPLCGPLLLPVMFSVARAVSRFECLLEVPTQWLPTGTGDQIWEPISWGACGVSRFFFTCFCISIWQALNPTALKSYSKYLLFFLLW